jgi:hypothetical protein
MTPRGLLIPLLTNVQNYPGPEHRTIAEPQHSGRRLACAPINNPLRGNMIGIFRRSKNQSGSDDMDITKPVRKAARKTASLARRGAKALTGAATPSRGRKSKASASRASTRTTKTRSAATRKRSTAKKAASRRRSR